MCADTIGKQVIGKQADAALQVTAPRAPSTSHALTPAAVNSPHSSPPPVATHSSPPPVATSPHSPTISGKTTLYVSEVFSSGGARTYSKIWAFRVNTHTGELSHQRLFADFNALDGVASPAGVHGMRCDVSGNLYVARYEGSTASAAGHIRTHTRMHTHRTDMHAHGARTAAGCWCCMMWQPPTCRWSAEQTWSSCMRSPTSIFFHQNHSPPLCRRRAAASLQVDVFAPSGKRLSRVALTMLRPVNLEIGGRDGKTLYAVGR
jgi:SMP-30/Gluconolactonase/LRE-like region